jgi:hypothetical protein
MIVLAGEPYAMLLHQGTPAFVVDVAGFFPFFGGALYIKGAKMGTPAFLPSFSGSVRSRFTPMLAPFVLGPVPLMSVCFSISVSMVSMRLVAPQFSVSFGVASGALPLLISTCEVIVMARSRIADEVQVFRFFDEAPLEKVETVFKLVSARVHARMGISPRSSRPAGKRSPQAAAPRAASSDANGV